ncbi:hypothetical protein J5Y04_02345 [Kitasatospora sp. RG8]|uniref:hypothetical protein n=1 Tax=Kitasatospora sp. RG8 TaxID=2820815 RepID=UPI001ADF75E8|nr:hypothetical protein [Kitasatospora sp. RG8]MBP0448393.1 hypothetical protein [Kitasatospora sp. RG8]
MCIRPQTTARHFVCLPCRVSVKRRAAPGHDRCPRCRGQLIDAGQDLAVPKRRDDAGWRALTAVLAAGVTFHSRCCYGPGWRPRTPREVRERLALAGRGGIPVAEAITTRDLDELSERARGRAPGRYNRGGRPSA